MFDCCVCQCLSKICNYLILLQVILFVIPWLYRHIIGPFYFESPINIKSYKNWAVITGATDGIGKSYVKYFAKKGFNIVLISRSLEKLKNVAEEIENEFKVKTLTIDVDFTKGDEIYEKIKNSLIGLEIGVLVNNVGISYTHPEYYLDIPNRFEFVNKIFRCNMISVTEMCAIILPQMISRKQGLIINLSSVTGLVPTPLLSLYAASKSFVDKFTEALQGEYKEKGIIIQSLAPGAVATNMLGSKKSSWLIASSDKYVQDSMKTIGFADQTSGYYPHILLYNLLPRILYISMPSILSKMTLSYLSGVKKRYLKKKQQEPSQSKNEENK